MAGLKKILLGWTFTEVEFRSAVRGEGIQGPEEADG